MLGGGGGGGAGSSKVSGEEGCMQALKYQNLSGISYYDRMRRGSLRCNPYLGGRCRKSRTLVTEA